MVTGNLCPSTEEAIDLCGSGIDRCQALSRLLSSYTTQLEELDVGNCDITEEAVAALAPTNTSHLKY